MSADCSARETGADQPSALITGVNGQDGSYLAEFLLAKGYKVLGTVRPGARRNLERIAHLEGRIRILELDLQDGGMIERAINEHCPAEVYNLAARASSSQLHSEPVLTMECNGIAVVHLLEAIRRVNRPIRMCQASSSEMFGDTESSPQNERSAFVPRNAYGAAKLYAHWMIGSYRRSHGLFACSAILFNHESPRRGLEFVSRKVSRGVAMIRAGRQERLELGDLEARRDWGFAGDYVRAMWLMLQAENPMDYVVATGETHSVRELCEIAFDRAGLDYRRFVFESAAEKRRPESIQLLGDPSMAEERLGWKRSVSFRQVVEMMVDADLASVGK